MRAKPLFEVNDQSSLADVGPHASEIELLLGACRTKIGPPAANHIREILRTNVDWTWLVQASLNHRVAALFFRGLLEEAGDQVPPELAAGAAEFIAGQREFNQRCAVELLIVLAAMKESGIAAVPFKGPVLSEVAYGDLGLRKFIDVDFLVHSADMPRCRRVLRELGYSIEADHDLGATRYCGQELFYKAGIAVEPHWKLIPSYDSIAIDLDGIWSRVVRAQFRGAEILSPSPEDLVTLLCVHGAKHEWSRLLWVCDIAGTIRTCNGLDWDSLLSRSRDQGCLRMVLLGLMLAKRLFECDIPEAVDDLAERDPTSVKLCSYILQSLFSDGWTAKRGGGLTRFGLGVRERMLDKTRLVAAQIFLPAPCHFRMVPGWLSFGAFPIKLLHNYCFPLWIIVRRVRLAVARRRQSF